MPVWPIGRHPLAAPCQHTPGSQQSLRLLLPLQHPAIGACHPSQLPSFLACLGTCPAHFLVPSAGNGARIAVICTITPASTQAEETHNTLKFASRQGRRRAGALQTMPQAPAQRLMWPRPACRTAMPTVLRCLARAATEVAMKGGRGLSRLRRWS